jgi:hypothetical protein
MRTKALTQACKIYALFLYLITCKVFKQLLNKRKSCIFRIKFEGKHVETRMEFKTSNVHGTIIRDSFLQGLRNFVTAGKLLL